MTILPSPNDEPQTFSWFVFGLMASVTFVGILSELVPSGILPQMSGGLGAEESEIGFLVGVYALASAVSALGEYLFKRPEPSYEIELDLFRNTK